MPEAGSKTSDAESPRFEEVAGGEAPPKGASEVDKAPLGEEEEEEDHDMHFTRKRKKPESKEPAPKEFTKQKATQKEPNKKQVVKRDAERLKKLPLLQRVNR